MSYNCCVGVQSGSDTSSRPPPTGYGYVTIQFLDETVVATLFVDEKRENQFSLRFIMSGNQLVPSGYYPEVADTQLFHLSTESNSLTNT